MGYLIYYLKMTQNNNGWRERFWKEEGEGTFHDIDYLNNEENADFFAVELFFEKEITEQRRSAQIEVLEELLKGSLCDYPKAESQKQHDYNIYITKMAEKRAKEIAEEKIKELKELKK